MSVLLALVVLAGEASLPAPPRPEQASCRYPEQVHGDMRAGLEVTVADRLHVPGLAGVTLTTCVVGGPALEVQPVRLSDSSSAWTVQGRCSAWTVGEEQAHVCEAIELVQNKPGPVSLPAVTVRFRNEPDQPWSKAEWSNLLGEVDDVPPPEGQEAAPSPWPRWLALAGAAAVGGVAALAAWRLSRRRSPVPPLSPEQRAMQELAALRKMPLPAGEQWDDYYTPLTDVLRRYLSDRLAIPAFEQSSTELVTSLCQRPGVDEQITGLLRHFLDSCDQARFAPNAGPPERFPQAIEMAERLLEQLRRVVTPQPPSS